MSHFSVVVCIDDPNKLEAALAPFDENLDVEPYRDYLTDWKKTYERACSFFAEHPEDRREGYDELDVGAVLSAYEGDTVLQEGTGDDIRFYTMSTYNPESKWDYWRIGGRWGGYFRYREGCQAQVIKPERGWDSPKVIMGNTCDGGPKSALDLDALREAKAAEARKTYAEFHSLVAGTPEARPWSEFADLTDKIDGYTIDQAREEYRSQPRVKAIEGTDFRWWDDVIATFQKPERLYVEIERARAVPGYALLTTDGKWMAPGRMGWFGCGSDDDSTRAGYWEVANAYIESLSDSTWLIAVDCHI